METHKTTLIIHIEQAELAVRMMEAQIGWDRPAGLSADEIINGIDPEVAGSFLRMAQAASVYLTQCVANGRRPS